MFRKIGIILIILLLATGIVCAVKNADDFKVPSEFSKRSSEGVYFIPNAYDNPSFSIKEVNDSGNYFKNESKYEVWAGSENNTYFFTDYGISSIGAIELIEVDGQKYIVSAQYASTIKDEKYLDNAMDSICEFNELNGIKPIRAN